MNTRVVVIDRDMQSGSPVFAGTRVPIQNPFDYLGEGDSLDVFLDQFPSVSREMAVAVLEEAREGANSPEHINDGPETHPSARLACLRDPSYSKPLHGSRVAERIGIERIRGECQHFDAWLSRIEGLPALA